MNIASPPFDVELALMSAQTLTDANIIKQQMLDKQYRLFIVNFSTPNDPQRVQYVMGRYNGDARSRFKAFMRKEFALMENSDYTIKDIKIAQKV